MATQVGTTGASTTGSATATAARIVRSLERTPEAGAFLADLSRRTGLSEGNVIRLALAMLRTAVDAKDEGKHFGIAESQDSLDTVLVGF